MRAWITTVARGGCGEKLPSRRRFDQITRRLSLTPPRRPGCVTRVAHTTTEITNLIVTAEVSDIRRCSRLRFPFVAGGWPKRAGLEPVRRSTDPAVRQL